ncbi:C45 family autoproteolytic acyltransferase/hydolase [Oceanobacillus timonensis]|uniref:C45 family autoproteolytic acyltransferase/hydolase n=1 Tax=Oceanobacillus timonensis TaxID=1926285 RepID=UPI001FE25AC4|nr:C45 family peptidase [Oceanobacillus timonensis]
MTEFSLNGDATLKLSGTSYQIGYKHGSTLKEKVHNSLATYEKMFRETVGYSWKEACEKALLHLTAIEEYNLNYMKEMEGVAAGANVKFEDILTLNTRSEIALADSPDGCTSFALTSPKTHRTWLAQNWDWKGEQTDSLISLEIQQANLPTLQFVTEAGIIGKIGCNSEGIGVCLNALVTNTWEPKVPLHLGLRAILESDSIEKAISKVDNNQIASPANFLIASHTGQSVNMEVSPIHTEQIHAKNGALIHTNHICAEEMKQKVREEVSADSYDRLLTIDKLTRNLTKENIKAEDLFLLLSDHENYPASICRHAFDENTSKFSGMETVFSIVMDLTAKKLSWMKGKPCEMINQSF